MINITGRA